jgi:RNA polymerase-associated protein LEO1
MALTIGYFQLYLLQFPNFLGIESKAFHHTNFQPPTTDHHSSGPASSTFSSYQTSNNTIRWRYSPRNPGEIQSNARILRWSDGSFTIQVASNPREQFELAAKSLAPPHIAPLKSAANGTNGGRTVNGPAPYDSRLDSHTYLTAPHEQAGLIRITNHVTSSLAVKSSTDQNDDALVKLQQSLAAAVKGNKAAADGGVEIINISEDPELAKKKAEVAEKEKLRAQRRRQQQEERERDRTHRVLGRSGLRPGALGAGLTIGGLEDDDGMGTSRTRTIKPKKQTRRRNSEYSDDEEEFRGMGRTREDEYDEDDGFLVPSDEEPEAEADGTEDEAELEDDTDDNMARPGKSGAKRGPPAKAKEQDVTTGRSKRRRVIEDEDEE